MNIIPLLEEHNRKLCDVKIEAYTYVLAIMHKKLFRLKNFKTPLEDRGMVSNSVDTILSIRYQDKCRRLNTLIYNLKIKHQDWSLMRSSALG